MCMRVFIFTHDPLPRRLLCFLVPFTRCVFSVGGDGALHVLDDADAKGYVKPHPTADARRKVARKSSSHTWRWGAGGAGKNNRDNGHRAGHSDDDNDGGGEQDGWPGERRRATQRERSRSRIRPEGGGHDAATTVPSGEAGAVAQVAVDCPTTPGQEAGVGKSGDGGRSVLLRQVVLSAHDGDSNTTARRDSGLPPQEARGMVHANDPHADSLGDDRLLAEPPESSTGSTASLSKSRYVCPDVSASVALRLLDIDRFVLPAETENER